MNTFQSVVQICRIRLSNARLQMKGTMQRLCDHNQYIIFILSTRHACVCKSKLEPCMYVSSAKYLLIMTRQGEYTNRR